MTCYTVYNNIINIRGNMGIEQWELIQKQTSRYKSYLIRNLLKWSVVLHFLHLVLRLLEWTDTTENYTGESIQFVVKGFKGKI